MRSSDSMPRYDALLTAPRLGARLGIELSDGALSAIDFLGAAHSLSGRRPTRSNRDPSRQVIRQLRDYFADPSARFRFPLAPAGTPFQRRVWRALTQIPAGTVESYGELARRLATSPRAVGAACRANPIPIVIPCHRVVAACGLGGYGGDTRGAKLRIKRWLLEHEGCLGRQDGDHARAG